MAVVVAGANLVDGQLLRDTLEAIVVERPKPTKRKPQNLCPDKAYDNPKVETIVDEHQYVGHIRRIGEEPPQKRERKYPLRRWVVERTFAWLSKCRAILVRYDKNATNYLGLLQLACAIL